MSFEWFGTATQKELDRFKAVCNQPHLCGKNRVPTRGGAGQQSGLCVSLCPL